MTSVSTFAMHLLCRSSYTTMERVPIARSRAIVSGSRLLTEVMIRRRVGDESSVADHRITQYSRDGRDGRRLHGPDLLPNVREQGVDTTAEHIRADCDG